MYTIPATSTDTEMVTSFMCSMCELRIETNVQTVVSGPRKDAHTSNIAALGTKLKVDHEPNSPVPQAVFMPLLCSATAIGSCSQVSRRTGPCPKSGRRLVLSSTPSSIPTVQSLGLKLAKLTFLDTLQLVLFELPAWRPVFTALL